MTSENRRDEKGRALYDDRKEEKQEFLFWMSSWKRKNEMNYKDGKDEDFRKSLWWEREEGRRRGGGGRGMLPRREGRVLKGSKAGGLGFVEERLCWMESVAGCRCRPQKLFLIFLLPQPFDFYFQFVFFVKKKKN